MNFKQFIRWRLVCFVQTHIRHCQECLGSNGPAKSVTTGTTYSAETGNGRIGEGSADHEQ